MANPPRHKRKDKDIRRGRVDEWGTHAPAADEVALKVSYRGSGKHKNYPAPNGEWVPVHRPGTALCAKIDEKNWHLLLKALQEAIKKSCVQLEVGEKYPVRVWVKINGTLHEARITNAMTGEYHGFPLEYESQLPDDPHDLLSNVPNVNVPIS